MLFSHASLKVFAPISDELDSDPDPDPELEVQDNGYGDEVSGLVVFVVFLVVIIIDIIVAPAVVSTSTPRSQHTSASPE